MIIVADRYIPRVEQAFAALGEVRLVDGRRIDPAALRDADVLLVRSVTRVDETLLAGSSVRLVGSATSGIDHVDRGYLAANGIGFAHAPGVNAQSVAEYVVAALTAMAGDRTDTLAGQTLGIVGYGHVGRRVAALADALGLRCLINDPPLADTGGGPSGTRFHSLAELVRQADILSLHLPLNRDGPYRSHHLVDRQLLSAMRPGVWLINTSRGPVVDTAALRESLETGDVKAVLDVWENEPAVDPALLEQVALATPHIAGYSVEGKYNATPVLYQAVCRHFEREPVWRARLPGETHAVDLRDVPPKQAVARMVATAYDIRADDARLRALFELPESERAAGFDRLRAEYPPRREFAAWSCIPPDDVQARNLLLTLGFDVKDYHGDTDSTENQ